MTLLRKVLYLLQNNILCILKLLNLNLNLTNILKNLCNIHFSKCNIFKDFIYLLAAHLTIFFFINQIILYLYNFIANLQFDCFVHILYFRFNLFYFCHFLLLFLPEILHSNIEILYLLTEIQLNLIKFVLCVLSVFSYFNIKFTF